MGWEEKIQKQIAINLNNLKGNKMKKILISILLTATLLLSSTAQASVMTMPDGSTHTNTITNIYRFDVAPGAEVRNDAYGDVLLPKSIEGNTVYTGAKVCLVPTIVNTSGVITWMQKETDRIVAQAWLVNKDNNSLLVDGVPTVLPNNYYFNSLLYSWKGDGCTEMVFANPVHLMHNVAVVVKCTNLSTSVTSTCKVTISAYAK